MTNPSPTTRQRCAKCRRSARELHGCSQLTGRVCLGCHLASQPPVHSGASDQDRELAAELRRHGRELTTLAEQTESRHLADLGRRLGDVALELELGHGKPEQLRSQADKIAAQATKTIAGAAV